MNRSKEIAELIKKELPSVPGTIERDLATNPFLRCHIKGLQKAAGKRAGRSLIKESGVFAVLRKWKDSF
jgi:hydroxyacylglutathione hydrolase